LFSASPIITALAGSAVSSKHPGLLPGLWFVFLGVVIAMLVGMIFLVIAEALVPSGSLPGPLYVARALRRQLGRGRRYAQITRILVRRGLLPYQRGGRRSELATSEGRARLARSLRLALEDGGVAFVKLGQVLSTRRDLLPAEFIAELARLQDDAPQVPWPQVEAVLRAELGAGVDEVFATFEREPLAAASIAPAASGWWSRYAARACARSSTGTWTSCCGWRSGCSAARAGAGPSARSRWRTASPTRSGRNSTCGSRPAT
jgi:ubiquinone biosynthesis protein